MRSRRSVSRQRSGLSDDHDALLDDTVALIERLNDLGYVVGWGSVVVHPDATVTFWLRKPSQTFIGDVTALGFAHRYDIKVDPLMPHPIRPRV
jgi:hypothetical protein